MSFFVRLFFFCFFFLFVCFLFFLGGEEGGAWRQIAGEMTPSMQTRFRMLLYTAFANISVFRYK